MYVPAAPPTFLSRHRGETIRKTERIRDALVIHHTRREIAEATGINPREVQYILRTLEEEAAVVCDRKMWPHEWHLTEKKEGGRA